MTCGLCRWSGEQKPPGDVLGLEKHLRQQMSLLKGDHVFTWSRARGPLRSPREVNVPIVRWNINSQIDEVENTADTVKGSESIYFPLLKTNRTCLARLSAVLHHSWVARSPSVAEPIYLVHDLCVVCLQEWTEEKRYWETHKPRCVLPVNVLAQLILPVWSNSTVFPIRHNCSNANGFWEGGNPGGDRVE